MRRLLLASIVLCACPARSKDAAPSASASAPIASTSAKPKRVLPPAPASPLVLALSGKDTPLPNGLAFMSEGGALQIVLASRPIGCDDFATKFVTDEKRIAMTIDMPPGPDRKYFAGHPVGVTGQLDAPGVSGSYLDQNRLVVQIDSAESKPGSRVKGWLQWARGANGALGTFEATVCPGIDSPPPTLTTEATGTVSGEVTGEPFQSKKAFAIVRHDKESDADYVSEIDFFGRDDVTCESAPATDNRNPSLAITRIGGASAKNDLSETIQPAIGMFAPTSWKVGKPRIAGSGWIELESLDFSRLLQGTVRVAASKGGAGGAFTAEICRK